MHIFKTNKTKCGYIFFPTFSNYKIPKSIFNDLKTHDLNKIGCPSVNSVKNKIFSANSYLTMEVVFGLKDNQPFYKYTLDEKTTQINEDIHTILNDLCVVQLENNVINFQLLSPYAFVTDDKELEFTTVMPNMKTENCEYIHGGFRPYFWIRNFNSSWTLKNPNKIGKLYFDLNNPFLTVIFNKSVDLEYLDPSKQILDFISQSDRVNMIRKNLKQTYLNASKRRPKKFLET